MTADSDIKGTVSLFRISRVTADSDIKGTVSLSLPGRKSEKGMVIEVKVQPRSSKKGIDGTVGNALRVKLTAPPAEGEANKQLIEVLSREFGIKKSSIRIIKGLASKNKVVEIQGTAALQIRKKGGH